MKTVAVAALTVALCLPVQAQMQDMVDAAAVLILAKKECGIVLTTEAQDLLSILDQSANRKEALRAGIQAIAMLERAGNRRFCEIVRAGFRSQITN